MGVVTQPDPSDAPTAVGISTGVLAEQRGDWGALVDRAAAFSGAAVELSALHADEVPGLAALLADPASWAPRFSFVSVHGPAKGTAGGTGALCRLLDALPAEAATVVVHPETIGDLASLAPYGRRVAVENMDRRKPDARTADELGRVFAALPDAAFCFDIAHAASVDPTLAAAAELLRRYGSRLSHLHVSSLDDHGHHVPVTGADWERYAPLLAECAHVPWILEAELETWPWARCGGWERRPERISLH
jgi:hypothetical protein